MKGWLICIGIVFSLGTISYLLGCRGNNKFFRREAMLIVGLGWISASLIGALPYYILQKDCSYADAFFESASGITTTGASVFSDLEGMSSGLQFWRCLSQWIGGLGIVVFFVAILSFLGAGAKILYDREASANSSDLNNSRLQSGVMNIIYLYIALTAACALSFHFAGMGGYDSICHAFTTLSTGGFSTHGESMAYFKSPTIEWITVVFMLLGGTSFLYLLGLIYTKGKDFKSEEVSAYLFIIVVSVITIAVNIKYDLDIDWHQAIRDSSFQVLSIMTTTGFATADFDQWLPCLQIILIGLMVIGGCSGSTAGGSKVIRILIAFKALKLELTKAYHPRLVKSLKVDDRIMDKAAISTSMNYLVLVVAVSFICIPILSFLEPQMSFKGIISAYCASLFNIGPGLAEVGPTQNFAQFSVTSKYLLSFLMLLGRIEFYALITIFMPSFWKAS